MREERGKLVGDQTIKEPFTLWGTIAGNVTADRGAKLYVRGSIYGNLIVRTGARSWRRCCGRMPFPGRPVKACAKPCII